MKLITKEEIFCNYGSVRHTFLQLEEETKDTLFKDVMNTLPRVHQQTAINFDQLDFFLLDNSTHIEADTLHLCWKQMNYHHDFCTMYRVFLKLTMKDTIGPELVPSVSKIEEICHSFGFKMSKWNAKSFDLHSVFGSLSTKIQFKPNGMDLYFHTHSLEEEGAVRQFMSELKQLILTEMEQDKRYRLFSATSYEVRTHLVPYTQFYAIKL